MQEQEASGECKRKLSAVRLWFIVGLICVICYGAYWNVNYILLSIQAEFARDQVATFSGMEKQARDGSARNAAEALQYVIDYYPSGTKQRAGSALDRIVEQARSRSVDEIVSILRAKTGRDFGNDPKVWLKETGSE